MDLLEMKDEVVNEKIGGDGRRRSIGGRRDWVVIKGLNEVTEGLTIYDTSTKK